MRTPVKLFIATMLLAGVSFYGCKTSAEKVKKAEENVSDANDELDKENAALKKEMEDYKKEQEALIASNEKSITEFNMRIANEKSEAKADYEKKIAELNQKNSDLKKKMKNKSLSLFLSGIQIFINKNNHEKKYTLYAILLPTRREGGGSSR